jgi:AcrR family transcriptional regulator
MAGAITRSKLLRAAAEAFAEYGFAGASLRRIQVAAGVNSATNHYHYGSKAALYHGVVRDSLETIIPARIRMMGAVDQSLPARQRLKAYLKAYMLPHLEIATTPEGVHYGKILARLLVEPRTPEVNAVFAEMVAPTRQEFIRQLGQIFPYAGPEKLARAVGLVVSTMALAPFDSIYAQVADRPAAQDRQAVLDAAPEFAAAGVIALCGPLAGDQ